MSGTTFRLARIPAGIWRAIGMAATLLVGWNGMVQAQGLLGLGFLPGQTTVQVFSIDPATGNRTPVLSTGALAMGFIVLAAALAILGWQFASRR